MSCQDKKELSLALPWFEALADGSTAADAAPQLPWETRVAVLAALSDLSPAAAPNRQASLLLWLHWAAVTRTTENWGTCSTYHASTLLSTEFFYGFLSY